MDLELKNFREEQLGLARAAAAIGAEVVEAHSPTREIISSVGRDIKLVADRQSDKAILEFLQKNSTIGVLSEESGESLASAVSDYRWIIDPLDGSFNFQRGLPQACVSVALWKGREPVIGVIRDFNGMEIYGAPGWGAWSQGLPISVSGCETNAQAGLATGLPLNADYGERGLAEFSALFRNYKKIRMLGSAAMSLAYVARGNLDAYHERGVNLWDVAAGIALVRAAGGQVSYSIDPSNRCWIAASNGKVGVELFECVAQYATTIPSAP